MPWPQRSPATTRGQAHGWRYTAYVLFGRGIKTDEYETLPEFNILDSASAVENAFADNIPAGQGVVVDDNQPYPGINWRCRQTTPSRYPFNFQPSNQP